MTNVKKFEPREYNKFVENETVEDFSLRYAPERFRRWSEFTVSNTAIGSISFLALEAIGASIALSYGYVNAFWGILVASLIIFILGAPICYRAAKHNIDIDLLARAAGFGYLGSTVTSLIYASFCFIFFALEAAIMAQALFLYTGLPLFLGYIISSFIIIPVVFLGMTAISRLQVLTQPFWLVLMFVPFIAVLIKEPDVLGLMSHLPVSPDGTDQFSWQMFGISLGISLSLIAQIGEQADYLRFMPDKNKQNRFKWWTAVILAGPGWAILGFLKQVGGILLASLVLIGGASWVEAKEPIHMYNAAYAYVFENPETALFVSFVFVIISQIKINVTNAYAGSLAWSNFFSRTTHTHLGRAIWVVFNIAIALMLMLMGVFEVLEKILGLYSNVAIAWIAAIFADLVINKPLGLSPRVIEFKRAHLFNINPVGCISTLVASVLAIVAFAGVFGSELQAFSSIVALVTALILSPVICVLTKGKYYIARQSVGFESGEHSCALCEGTFEGSEMAACPMISGPICSVCCSVEGRCNDLCKEEREFDLTTNVAHWFKRFTKQGGHADKLPAVIGFLTTYLGLLAIFSFLLWTSYIVQVDGMEGPNVGTVADTYFNLFYLFALIIFVGSWLIVLMRDNRRYVEVQRQAAEDELARTESKLRMALDNMPGAMWVVDKDLRIELVNQQYVEYYGDSDGLVAPGVSIVDVLRSEIARERLEGTGTPAEILKARIAAYQSQSPVMFEDTSEDGKILQLTRVPVSGGQTVSVAIDITERKKAEHQIEIQRAQLDSILSNIPQGALLLDKSKNIIAWNKSYTDILRLNEGELRKGMSLNELTLLVARRGDYGDGDPVDLAKQRVENLWKGNFRSDISFSDDRSFDAHSARTPDGGLIVTLTDITERKKSERIISQAMTLINESIQYASRIQRSVLPEPKVLEEIFDDHVVVWKPKDVVGGDIYLYRECDAGHLLLLADCTGHGVPGAFMTMITTGALDQALIENPSGDPASLLTRINKLVKTVLGQDTQDGESDDGLECGLCLIDDEERKIVFVGARFELWSVKDDELSEIKGDKVGLGYRRTPSEPAFTKHVVLIEENTSYYMTSDGLIDQIGGNKRLAFGKRRLKRLILDYSRMEMANQGAQILRDLEEYQHNEERRDDISLIGFKPK